MPKLTHRAAACFCHDSFRLTAFASRHDLEITATDEEQCGVVFPVERGRANDAPYIECAVAARCSRSRSSSSYALMC